MKKQFKKEVIEKKEYDNLISSIGTLLEDSRKIVYSQINQILVKIYWEVGKRIIEYEQKGKARADYGSKLLDNLSKDLTNLYGKGFSRDNLEKMRKFYTFFPNSETLSRKLSWSHYCLIMRLDNPLARKFYIKDPYVLEFLGLEKLDVYSETELEEKIITNLQKFLLELGKGFMFVARQQKITLEDEHFYIDLVFYNRLLKCFVLIELKIGKLTHKDLGQLQMYVNYYDREIKQKEENPTIGILLCADKKEAIVKYTLPENNKQLFASKYKLYLPSKEELEEEVEKLV